MALKFLMAKKTGHIDLSVITSKTISVFDIWNAASDSANVFFTRPFNQVLLAESYKSKTSFSR